MCKYCKKLCKVVKHVFIFEEFVYGVKVLFGCKVLDNSLFVELWSFCQICFYLLYFFFCKNFVKAVLNCVKIWCRIVCVVKSCRDWKISVDGCIVVKSCVNLCVELCEVLFYRVCIFLFANKKRCIVFGYA